MIRRAQLLRRAALAARSAIQTQTPSLITRSNGIGLVAPCISRTLHAAAYICNDATQPTPATAAASDTPTSSSDSATPAAVAASPSDATSSSPITADAVAAANDSALTKRSPAELARLVRVVIEKAPDSETIEVSETELDEWITAEQRKYQGLPPLPAGEDAPKLTRSERRHAARKLGEPSPTEVAEVEGLITLREKMHYDLHGPPREAREMAEDGLEKQLGELDKDDEGNEDDGVDEYSPMSEEEFDARLYDPTSMEDLAEDRLELAPDASPELKQAFQELDDEEKEREAEWEEQAIDQFQEEEEDRKKQELEVAKWKTREAFLLHRKHKKYVDPFTNFFTSLKMTDHAEKFKGDIAEMLKLKTRDLKEMGLSVKQRKTFLKLMDRYKVQMRCNQALALIRSEGYSLPPAVLQERVYKVMYGHIYEANEVRERNVEITREWREPIEEHRLARADEHNAFRGLREPELMEMAKVEATQIAAAREYIKSQLPTPEQIEELRKRRAEEKAKEEDGEDGVAEEFELPQEQPTGDEAKQ